jgi:hypothetical protein
MSLLINKSNCRRYLLETAPKIRAHKFTRVKTETILAGNEMLRQFFISHIRKLPSCGKSI